MRLTPEMLVVTAIEADAGRARSVHSLVLVPVFNHAGTIIDVVSGIVARGYEVLVVDDGSTDETPLSLQAWRRANPAARVEVITHPKNMGKAAALRTGFARAAEMGATHAVTIDADGQLDPADIPGLLEEAERYPAALILGRRPDRIEGCPQRCIVGRRNASLGVLAQTGLRLSDTQCGLRVYPLALLAAVACRASRYAFEAEVITRAAWAGYEIREVPVSCRYFSGAQRISHFQPWRDSLRQGYVHATLVAIALAPWSRARSQSDRADPVPRHWIHRVWDWLDPLRSWRRVRKETTGDLEMASGLAIGAWIGTLPFYGLHTVLSLYVAWRLHLQPATVVLGSQVSMPPFGVALAAASIAIGHFLLTGTLLRVDTADLTLESVWRIPLWGFADWLVGSMVLGVGVAAAAYFLGLWIARRARRADHLSLPAGDAGVSSS